MATNTRPATTTNPNAHAVAPVTGKELLTGPELREFMMLVGKDGVGKSSAIVSLAAWVAIMSPEAQFFVIDTENKFRTALRSFGDDAPDNIVYYKTDDMNQLTWAVDQVLKKHRPGDWLAVESMSRVWERAQDLGYQAVTQANKAEYLERRAKSNGSMAVTPKPDELWSIVKGAHDGAFLDRLSQSETLNVVLSSTISRPPKEGSFMKENAERKSARAELGIDAGIDGAPRLPYYVETLAMLNLKDGAVTCRVLRDNLNMKHDDTRPEFDVDNRKAWAMAFWENCR